MNIKIIQKKSPNFDKRPKGAKINSVVIHYTGMKTFNEAFKRLCDKKTKVSSHYLIGRDGRIIKLVDEKNRAWHAGTSHWKGINNINDISIGIELENPGHEFGYIPFSNLADICDIFVSAFHEKGNLFPKYIHILVLPLV